MWMAAGSPSCASRAVNRPGLARASRGMTFQYEEACAGGAGKGTAPPSAPIFRATYRLRPPLFARLLDIVNRESRRVGRGAGSPVSASELGSLVIVPKRSGHRRGVRPSSRRPPCQRRFPHGSAFLAGCSPLVRLIVSLYAFSISAASFFFCCSALFASALLGSSSA